MQVDSFDQDTMNKIWSVFYYYLEEGRKHMNRNTRDCVEKFLKAVHIEIFEKPIDERSHFYFSNQRRPYISPFAVLLLDTEQRDLLKDFWFHSSSFNKKMCVIKLFVENLKISNIGVIDEINKLFEEKSVSYRIQEDGTIINIHSDLEYEEIEVEENQAEDCESEKISEKGEINITLQEEVFNHVEKLLNDGHYFNAVEEAFKFVRRKLYDITGEEKATDAFNEANYEKIFGSNPNSKSEEDFFQGVKFLHMAIQFLRNQRAHTPKTDDLDKNLAIHYISLVSLAYILINKNNTSEE